MKSSKVIDVSQASLVSLKAELSRKQEEVNKAKTEAQASFIHPVPRQKKEQEPHPKLVKDVSEEDSEKRHEDEELHRKSRATLEAKTRLYDKLMQASSLRDDDDNEYLVNFEQKALENENAEKQVRDEDKEEDDIQHNSDEYGSASDSEEEWVDYTDCLGRTRRCLKCDLEFVKDKDIQLATSLGFCVDKKGDEDGGKQETTGPLKPDLMSNDMRREQLRQKWEEQEELLKDKKDIHYQDVLFDEARSHGVGYFAFAQDEEERRRQQEALAKLREDTHRQQDAAKEVRRRRQAALSARVRAARNRQRARLGLPPEPAAPEPNDVDDDTKEDEEAKRVAEMEADRLAKEEEIIKKAQTVRPWDFGKEKRKPFQEMSQEDWVKKKRKERNDEFAPPRMYEENKASSSKSRASKSPDRESPEEVVQQKYKKIVNEVTNPIEISSDEETVEQPRGKGTEIPPPPTYEYYGHSAGRGKGPKKSAKMDEIEKSISVGLKFLRKQQEEKAKKKDKGLLDII
ncbi:uncharacterized protein GBIM_11045 [Gryllus bimaculatus]|nr:uncharacterized protein GBIM_11045 [Gryllus bimaculatus]